MSEMMREAWSVIGWRSASYASRISAVAQPWRTPASFQARLAASAIPAPHAPKPPASGIHTCAASPQMNTPVEELVFATSRRATQSSQDKSSYFEVRPDAENRAGITQSRSR